MANGFEGMNKLSKSKNTDMRLGFGLDTLDPTAFTASVKPPAPPPTPSKEFLDFKQQVYFTLASRIEGYDNVPELVQDLK